MAPCKSSAADGDPGLCKPLQALRSSFGRHMKDWMTPSKRSAEGNYGHQLKKWTSLFKSSTEGGRICKLKELPHMMVQALEMWPQRWRCTVDRVREVPDKRPKLQKWKRVFKVIVLSTCFISAVRYKSLCKLGPLVTVVVVSSMLPARVSAERDDKLDFDAFPLEIQGRILGNLRYEQVFQLKSISRSVKRLAESDEFQASPLRKKPSLTACYFFIETGVWRWAGFDPSSQEWRLLPPLTCLNLPPDCKPDPDLFKEFLTCAKDGLVCINFSKSVDRERLIVFNPLSGVWKELPPMNHRRNPVLMHILVNPDTRAYQVIVAGSSKAGDEDLSRITEVFDSSTGIWTRTGDILGPLYALNEFQSGVYHDGKLFCIAFVEENDQVGKGIIAYDVEEGIWSCTWTHLLPFSMSSTILQLVENHGEVFLFSEREIGRSIEHWVDRLEWIQANGDETKNTCQLITVIQRKKDGGRSLEVYPEYTCVPYDVGRLCIVNAIDHTGVIYDVRDPEQSQVPLKPLPEEGFRGELGFFSLNPLSFAIEPRFSSKVYQLEEGLKSVTSVEDHGVIEGPEEGPKAESEEGQGSEPKAESEEGQVSEPKAESEEGQGSEPKAESEEGQVSEPKAESEEGQVSEPKADYRAFCKTREDHYNSEDTSKYVGHMLTIERFASRERITTILKRHRSM